MRRIALAEPRAVFCRVLDGYVRHGVLLRSLCGRLPRELGVALVRDGRVCDRDVFRRAEERKVVGGRGATRPAAKSRIGEPRHRLVDAVFAVGDHLVHDLLHLVHLRLVPGGALQLLQLRLLALDDVVVVDCALLAQGGAVLVRRIAVVCRNEAFRLVVELRALLFHGCGEAVQFRIRILPHAPSRSLPALCERGKPEKCVCADDDFLFMVVFLSVLQRQQRRPRAKNAISRENLQMLCPFREYPCSVEGASGNGKQAQLGKTGAKWGGRAARSEPPDSLRPSVLAITPFVWRWKRRCRQTRASRSSSGRHRNTLLLLPWWGAPHAEVRRGGERREED